MKYGADGGKTTERDVINKFNISWLYIFEKKGILTFRVGSSQVIFDEYVPLPLPLLPPHPARCLC